MVLGYWKEPVSVEIATNRLSAMAGVKKREPARPDQFINDLTCPAGALVST